LIRRDWTHLSRVKVRFAEPPAAVRRRLFSELAQETAGDPGRLTMPQAVGAIIARHPDAPDIARLFDPRASALNKADFSRTLRREWQAARRGGQEK
jgi:hypothetical protein